MQALPNLLTLLRIILIPVLVVLYFTPIAQRETVVTMIFIVAALTDWLDGFLARRWNAQSKLGAFLDPVADKLVVSSALVLLVADSHIMDMVYAKLPFTVAVLIIIGREIVISALREWMAELGRRSVVAVGMLGKIKTTLQMVAIAGLLYAQPLFGLPLFKLAEIALYIAAALTLWTMVVYLKVAMRDVSLT